MRGVARVGITRPLLMKRGGLFFLSDPDGHVEPSPGLGLGLFHRDCRYLARYELTLGGRPPVVLSASAAAGFAATLDLTNEATHSEGASIPEHAVIGTWRRTLREGDVLEDRIALRNCSLESLAFELSLALEARFEDIFTLRGQPPGRRGTVHEPHWDGRVLRFRYDGADGVRRGLVVTPQPVARRCAIAGEAATLDIPLTLPPQAEAEVVVKLAIDERRDATTLPSGRSPIVPRKRAPSPAWRVDIACDDRRLDGTLARALADVALLSTERDGCRFVAGGVPWFVALFGRDSLVPALQCLAFDPDLAGDTLRLLARFQGDRHDPWRKEEPGKILHEYRVGEIAHLGEAPQRPGYGSIDSTILFLIVLAAHARCTGSTALFEELRGTVERALLWLATDADADRDGYVDYDNGRTESPANQGWKDSADAVSRPDGSLVRGRIALAEVQGYAYLARTGIAELYHRTGDAAAAERLRTEADALRSRFNRDFWMEDEGCFCLGLDEAGKRIGVVSSNPGQALWTGIVDADKAAATAARLMASDMFSGWGVRTLSSRAGRFNPIGYHTGSVWPFDNSLIMAGLKRYGCIGPALRMFEAMRDAALEFDLLRLPEFFSGVARRTGDPPARCPRADPLQAWSAGALPMMVTALLGLEPDGFEGRLRIVRPQLPGGVSRLELRRLRVGNAHVDLRFVRHGGTVAVEPLVVDGALAVSVIDGPVSADAAYSSCAPREPGQLSQ